MFPRSSFNATLRDRGKVGKCFNLKQPLWQKKRLNFTSIHWIPKECRASVEISSHGKFQCSTDSFGAFEGGDREREVKRRSRAPNIGRRASPLQGAWPRFSTLRNRKNYCPETSLWRRAACNPWLQAVRCVRVCVSRDSWTTEQRYLDSCSRPVPTTACKREIVSVLPYKDRNICITIWAHATTLILRQRISRGERSQRYSEFAILEMRILLFKCV